MEHDAFEANVPQNNSQKLRHIPKINKPSIVGYMSVDVSREFHHDLTQLKYLTSIPEGRLHYDLNHNIDKAVKRTTDTNNEKITLLLKFILHQKERLKPIFKDMTFITYRRSLISAMCHLHLVEGTSIKMVASLFNNCIYLCSVETTRKSCWDISKFCAWGYKYEQYMLSDAPDLPPDTEKPVIENEEFTLYYYTELGNHRLFYGAQIDGMLATEGQHKQVPHTDDVDENLAFLRKSQYVELKTNKNIRCRMHDINFIRNKLIKCWCQCILADLKGLLVGFRNNNGIIQSVKWFDTDEIVWCAKTLWSPEELLCELNNVLDFIKESFKSMRRNGDDGTTTPLTLVFNIDKEYTVTRADKEEDIILPSWYINNFKEQA